VRHVLTPSWEDFESYYPEDSGDAPQKRRFLLEPHDFISQKTTSFIVTTVTIFQKTAVYYPTGFTSNFSVEINRARNQPAATMSLRPVGAYTNCTALYHRRW
jgi:hypothetical protein